MDDRYELFVLCVTIFSNTWIKKKSCQISQRFAFQKKEPPLHSGSDSAHILKMRL